MQTDITDILHFIAEEIATSGHSDQELVQALLKLEAQSQQEQLDIALKEIQSDSIKRSIPNGLGGPSGQIVLPLD